MSLKIWMATVLSVLALVACGGGGGGGADAQVKFDVARVSATAFHGQQDDVNASEPASIEIGAKITGELSGTVYLVVSDTGKGFAGRPIEVVRSGGDNYRATLHVNIDLAPGDYTGELELHLCKDLACTSEYSVAGGTLDYSVTILAQLEATVLVNGVPAGVVRSGRTELPLALANGSTVEIRTNVPAEVRYSSGPGFVTVTEDAASTNKAWKAVIALDAFPTTRQLQLVMVPADSSFGNQMGAVVNIDVVGP
jgi:hypothetical protein